MSDRVQVDERQRTGVRVDDLFVAHYPRLLGLARLVCADPAGAEDLVQDAFFGLYRRRLWIRESQAALAYLQRAVVNGAKNQRRAAAVRTAHVVTRTTESATAGPEDQAVLNAEHTEILDALATLPMRQRQVLVLRYFLDQSEAQTAGALSISKGSVKQHASRGLAALALRIGARS